jgi:hypothetical protein
MFLIKHNSVLGPRWATPSAGVDNSSGRFSSVSSDYFFLIFIHTTVQSAATLFVACLTEIDSELFVPWIY